MKTRLNIKLQYPLSIYIVVSIFSVATFLILYDLVISFKGNFSYIEFGIVTLMLIFLKNKSIEYKSKNNVDTFLTFYFPVILIYGLYPVIITELFNLFRPSKVHKKKPLFRRYFNFTNVIVSAWFSYYFFKYFSEFENSVKLKFVLLILVSALIYSFFSTFIIRLMFYLEKKVKYEINYNIFQANIMNGVIAYYLYSVLGIYGLFIAVLYAFLLSKKSFYKAKYLTANQELSSFESEFYKINSELYEAEQRLRLIFNTIDYGIIVFDLDKRVKMANPVAIKFLKEFFDDPIGKSVFDLNIIYPKEVYDIIEWTIANEENYYQKKLAAQIKDDLIYLDIYTYPYRIAEGKMDGIILLYKNVTEEHLIRRQLVEADKLSHMGQIAAGKVHEIKNPLTTVRGYIQFLQQRVAKGETINLNHFDIALQELDRTNELINSLLILSKHSEHKHESLELSTLLQEVIQLFLHQMQMKNINFEQEIEEGLYILGVENHLKQIFINLILNAIDAVDRKPAEAFITIRANRSKNMVVVEIEDNGVGISPINIERLHVPFFTTKETGTGLGLSVTFKLVEEHSGIINVYSEQNAGTKFVIKFSTYD